MPRLHVVANRRNWRRGENRLNHANHFSHEFNARDCIFFGCARFPGLRAFSGDCRELRFLFKSPAPHAYEILARGPAGVPCDPAAAPRHGLLKLYGEKFCELLPEFEHYAKEHCEGGATYFGYRIPAYLGVIAETESGVLTTGRILMGCAPWLARMPLLGAKYKDVDWQISCAARTLCRWLKKYNGVMLEALEMHTPTRSRPPLGGAGAENPPGFNEKRMESVSRYIKMTAA